MVRLYVRDSVTGTIHEYGTNPHDSLILNEDGSIHYQNLQNSTGTRYPEEGYCFCLEDGSIPDNNVEPYESILDVGGEYHNQHNSASKSHEAQSLKEQMCRATTSQQSSITWKGASSDGD